MAFTRWKNPYIDRLAELSGCIVDQGKPPINEDLRAMVQAKREGYENLYVEFGSGSGGHLLRRASQDPASLYVGFELRFKRIFRTAEKGVKLGLSNFLLIRCSSHLAPEFFPAGSVDGLYVYFPDPWSKKRWHKHRMLNENTLLDIVTLLKPGGILRYKTDHSEYFNDTLASLRRMDEFRLTKTTDDLRRSPYAEGDILSEFEQLFRSKHIPVNFLEAVRIVPSGAEK